MVLSGYFSVITDLIQEAKETKGAIEDATRAMQNANTASHHTEQKKAEAMQMSTNFESNLYDFHGGGPPASAPAPRMDNNGPPPIEMYRSQPPRAHQQTQAPNGVPNVQTASSEEPEAADQENEGNDDDSDGQELFSNGYGQPAPAPAPMPAPAPAPMPQQQYSAPPTPQQQYSAPTTPQYQQPSVYSQPSSAQPTPNMGRPVAMSKHTSRQSSLGFNPEFIMGGSAEPLPDSDETGISPAARTKSSSADFGYEDEESYQNVEEMKKKAEAAAAAARDAEAAHRRLLNEADELRADADKADANARSLKAAAAEKKGKGRFVRGGGDKKKTLVRAQSLSYNTNFPVESLTSFSLAITSVKPTGLPRMPRIFANDLWKCRAKPRMQSLWQ